jgi:hypothetical protein
MGGSVPQQPSAQHRAIVVVDVEGFTDPSRTTTHLVDVQQGLYRLLKVAFGEVGIDLAECDVGDRGDGALILVPPTVSKTLLADQLPDRLVVGLRRYNATHSDEAKIKLRVSLHAGEVHLNADGAVGKAVNLTFRILEAQVAKSALAKSDGLLALIASTHFFDEVIAEDPGLGPENYRRIPVNVKKTKTEAWLWLPGATTPWEVPPVARPAESGGEPLDVFADTDLAKLRSILTDLLDLPHLEILVHRATDSEVPLPRRSSAWDVFQLLSDVNAGPDGIPPNLAFLDLLAKELGGETGAELVGWVDQQAVRFRVAAAIQERRAGWSDIQKQQHLHLVFAVQPDAIDETRCRLTYWRQVDPQDWPPPRGSTEEIAVEDLELVVDKLITETERAWSGESVTAALEFVLPRTLLHVPVHRWQKEYLSGEPRPLCLDYQITVRSLERMQAAHWHRLWRMRWRSMLEDPAAGRVYFSLVAASKEYRIDAVLSDLQWVGVVMAKAPTPRPQPSAAPDELIAALRSGIPVIFWHPTASSREVREIVEWLLANGGLAELPSRVGDSRKSVYAPLSVPFDADLARDLVVLFDNPTRLIAIDQPIMPSIS